MVGGKTIMWEYSLTPQEEGISVEVGYQRQRPYFGDPTHNVNYSEGDLWETWQHSVAVGSELAFARMVGKNDFIPHYNKWKSELDIPGLGEVRYSFRDKPQLRYTVRDNDSLIYILLADGLRHKTRRNAPDYKGTPYRAVGWMVGADCKKDEWRYNEKTWYVPLESLMQMKELDQVLQGKG
jgi:hypothetical protein